LLVPAPLEPEVPDPVAPEPPDEDPEDPVVPPPLEVLPEVPLAPELCSPARRSQPTAVMLSTARINSIFEVILMDFILVPFVKN